MRWPRRYPTRCHADFLLDAVALAHSGANQALRELAEKHHLATLCTTRAPFLVRLPGDTAPLTIPRADFHRRYTLCLQTLELTIYGYCVYKKFGWEGRQEAVLSLSRPPFWRRMVSPAPLLAIRLVTQAENISVSINSAHRPGYKNKRNHFIRMNEELQEQMTRAHNAQIATRSIKARIGCWLRRLFRN